MHDPQQTGPLSGGLNPRPPRWEAPTVPTTATPSPVQRLSVALKTANGGQQECLSPLDLVQLLGTWSDHRCPHTAYIF